MSNPKQRNSLPQESVSYIWYQQDKLGQGATGQVFMCKDKKTGQEYAAKVFTVHGMSRQPYVNDRELEVLERLRACNHENIAKIIAIEEERHTGSHVIIMELCVESLQTLIEKPENAFGFEEEDFKQVVHDVVSGMKYLRNDQGIIHRDIKPANILRFIEDDGSFIYKLTDFGAARKLAPEECYTSIYGTEEYLHPDMYEKGVMKQDAGKTFGENVDLWSLGVTVYHIATGKLPFRPYGGSRDRKQRDIMFQITTRKESGVISGIQKQKDGAIEWSDKLPENTRLSSGLKKHLVKILAKLLESDPEKGMKFDEFFQVMEQFLEMKVIHVYSARSGSFHTLYANPDDNFARFQELIAVETNVSARQQDLFYNNDVFKPQSTMATVSMYPDITKDKPIIVLGGDTSPSEKLDRQGMFKEMKFTNDVSPNNLDADLAISKTAASQVHWYLHTARNLERARSLTMEAAENIVTLLKRKARKYLNDAQTIENHCHSMVMKHETCVNGCEFELKVMQSLGSDGDIPQAIINEKEHLMKETGVIKEKVDKLQEDMSGPLERLREKAHSLLADKELVEKWRNMNKDVIKENYVGIVQNFSQKICEIMSNFLSRRRNNRSLSTYDMENHKFERYRLVEYFAKVKDVMEACQSRRQTIHDHLLAWLEGVYEYRSCLKSSRTEAQSYIDMFDALVESEEQWRSDHMSRMENILKEVRAQVRRVLSVPEQREITKDEKDGGENVTTPETNITKEITNKIGEISSETKKAKLCLQENTEKFQKFVQELMEGLNEKNTSEEDEGVTV